jgi:hypothetical protein
MVERLEMVVGGVEGGPGVMEGVFGRSAVDPAVASTEERKWIRPSLRPTPPAVAVLRWRGTAVQETIKMVNERGETRKIRRNNRALSVYVPVTELRPLMQCHALIL